MLQDIARLARRSGRRSICCAVPHWDFEFRHFPQAETRALARKARRRRGRADRRRTRPCGAAGRADRRRACRLRARRFPRHRPAAPALARPYRRDPRRGHQRRCCDARRNRGLPVPAVPARAAGQHERLVPWRTAGRSDRAKGQTAVAAMSSAIAAADKRAKNRYRIAWVDDGGDDGHEGFHADDEVIAGIKADLERYEAERGRAHPAVMWRVPVFMGLFLLAIIAASPTSSTASPTPTSSGSRRRMCFSTSSASSRRLSSTRWRRSPARKLQQSLREKILPVVFGFIERYRLQAQQTPISFERLPRETVAAFNRQSFDDVISGRYEDFPFELYEATLSHEVGQVELDSVQGRHRGLRNDHAISGPAGGDAQVRQVAEFFRGMFGGSKLEELQSGIAALDEPTSSAPTMSKPRGRW